jgi:predicted ArsR family transcriptional regulator
MSQETTTRKKGGKGRPSHTYRAAKRNANMHPLDKKTRKEWIRVGKIRGSR